VNFSAARSNAAIAYVPKPVVEELASEAPAA